MYVELWATRGMGRIPQKRLKVLEKLKNRMSHYCLEQLGKA